MLGTLSEPRRGQMSHICDISALRVNIDDAVLKILKRHAFQHIISILSFVGLSNLRNKYTQPVSGDIRIFC